MCRAHGVGIDVDLVLLYKAADRRDLGDAVGQAVVSKVRDAEQPLCRREQAGGEDVGLDPGPQDDGGEESSGSAIPQKGGRAALFILIRRLARN